MSKEFVNMTNALVVNLKGEIDQCVVSEVKEKIDAELLNSQKNNLIMNFEKVSLMDSSGIGLIVGRYKNTRALGGKLLLCGGNRNIRKMIELSGVDKIAQVFRTVEEANSFLAVN